ncbi:MAG: PEP-CTERM sorting domain-containing protein [Proteobacteria bacterium]|nr:PEP-CTERM sorting domain-containing protein [Pseudomonadota bacterium]
MGCWTHQAYAMSHFASFGFTQNFFDADPAFAAQNSGFGAFSSLLSNGSTQTGVDNGAVPEPATWLMMIAGFGLLGAAMRRHPAVRVTYA